MAATSEELITSPEEICVIVAGNVDAGKSTLIGVLTGNSLDDGNGLAREFVAKHKHEKDTGRTSDISIKTIQSPTKNVLLVDTCGHQKYLKTTLYGITGHYPDYGVIVIAANKGIMKMTKEYLTIYLHMGLPFIIVITRSDLVVDNIQIYNQTLKTIKTLILNYNKKLFLLNTNAESKLDDSELNLKHKKIRDYLPRITNVMQKNTNLVPVITVSNKTGYYIDMLKELLLSLKSRHLLAQQHAEQSTFYIDSKFYVKGVGLVIAGIVKGDTINLGDKMMIGPYGTQFLTVKVISMHDNYRNPVTSLTNHTRGCLAIRVLDKKIHFNKDNVKKGMIVIKSPDFNNIAYEFICSVKILNHTTTIGHKYSPVIHCGTIRQTAQIIINKDNYLTSGDEKDVRFKFIKQPEYLEVGSKFFFREGTTRGVGTITSVIPITKK